MSTSGPYDPNQPPTPPPYSPYPPTYPGAAPGQPLYGQPPYGQPPYGQPYGAPPMYPAYPGYPPPQPQKNSNRTLWIILGVVGGVLLLACLACVGIVYVVGQQVASSPLLGSTVVVSTFCAEEESQDYAAAYNQLSANLQGQMTQDQFVSRSEALDTSNGTVSQCSPAPSGDAAQGSSNVSFDMTIQRDLNGTTSSSTGTITVVNSGGSWKIDTIDSSLGLT